MKKIRFLPELIEGIGEHLDIDPVLLQLLWVAIVVFTGIVPGRVECI